MLWNVIFCWKYHEKTENIFRIKFYHYDQTITEKVWLANVSSIIIHLFLFIPIHIPENSPSSENLNEYNCYINFGLKNSILFKSHSNSFQNHSKCLTGEGKNGVTWLKKQETTLYSISKVLKSTMKMFPKL